MELPNLNKFEKLWDIWDIPTCILISLFLQCFLVLFASFRQSSKNSFLQFLIWSAYLSADWIAVVTVGLIIKVLANPHHPHLNHQLYAFWASFLLLHLGGPDTITSYSLQDNELWLRHLLGLILQLGSAAYCIFLTLSNKQSMWVPTILIFVVGSVKYAERTLALYLASLKIFDATVGYLEDPNPHDLASDPEIGSSAKASAGTDHKSTEFGPFNLPSDPDRTGLLMLSYSLFKGFKDILYEYPLNSKLVESSKKLFVEHLQDPKARMEVIEYELSLMYEVFHTKAAALSSRIGLVIRFISFCLIVGAFIWFQFAGNKHEFEGTEKWLTYSLLIGAIGVDAISGIQLMFCDWMLVSNDIGLNKWWRKYVPKCVLRRRRWGGSVPQYNMIDYILHDRWLWKLNNMPDFARSIVDKIKMMLFSSSEDDIEDLKRFIFKTIPSCLPCNKFFGLDDVRARNWKQIMISHHLTAEIGYHMTRDESRSYSDERKRSRRRCKLISSYIFYLCFNKPEIVSPSGLATEWKESFQRMYKEVKKYLMEQQNISDYTDACNKMCAQCEEMESEKGDFNRDNPKTWFRSLMYVACKGAEELKLEESGWESLSVELLNALCFAAVRNRPVPHAEQTSKGGELLTFIWCFLYHLRTSEEDKNADDEGREKDFRSRLMGDGAISAFNVVYLEDPQSLLEGLFD